MEGDSKLVWLIILIIVVIIVSILLFRNYYKTEEERNDNMNKLYIGIGVGIVAVILGAYLMSGENDEQEHGVRDSVRNWWRQKREEREAGADAKRAAQREVKERQRDEKRQSRADEERGRASRQGQK